MKYEEVEVNSERWFDLKPLLNEEFRDIKGYEGYYQVSNYGRVKRLAKIELLKSKNQYNNFCSYRVIKERILTNLYSKGYCRVTLSQRNKKKIYQVHRLVAEVFIPNPKNLPEVNHKREKEKDNNLVSNLEWCTSKQNCNYGNRNKKISLKVKKKIIQLNCDFEIIKVWDSVSEASNYYKVTVSNITQCLRRRNKTACGYIWRYYNE